MAGFLEQIMGGGGGGGLPPSIPDPEGGGGVRSAAPPAAAEGGGSSEVGTLKEMLGLANAYKGISTVTEQERAQMEKATTILQTLLASNEKMSDQMTGATPALRKAYGAGG